MVDYNKLLRIPRGTKARLEEIKLDLLENTIVYATDTKELGIKLSDGNIEYFKNATDIGAIVDTLETSKQDKLVAGDNITIVGNTISASGEVSDGITDAPADDKLYGRKNNTWEEVQGGGEVDLNEMSYFDYAGSIYGAKYSLLANAWEHSLTVDNTEIAATSTTLLSKGLAQYPDNETEGIIIPHGITSIGEYAFYNAIDNNMPLVIPNSVTSIGGSAFRHWLSNNQPLVIPDSVTSIGDYAFNYWESNNHPLVIPDSVTSIGADAFSRWDNVPYVEMKSTTPPTLVSSHAFTNINDAPIYVPDASVNDYKIATNWVDLANRIFPVSDLNNYYSKTEIDNMIGDIESVLDTILGV